MNKVIRQGDVVIRKVDKLPSGLRPRKSNILAYGEITGHNHKVVTPNLEGLHVYEDSEGRIYFEALTDVEVVHQEHKVVTVPLGRYEVVIERERDPFLRTIQTVQD